MRNNCSSGLSDDEPLYDSVASDDDYYTIQVGMMVNHHCIGDDSAVDEDCGDETMMPMMRTMMMLQNPGEEGWMGVNDEYENDEDNDDEADNKDDNEDDYE